MQGKGEGVSTKGSYALWEWFWFSFHWYNECIERKDYFHGEICIRQLAGSKYPFPVAPVIHYSLFTIRVPKFIAKLTYNY
jgi:hypothetical protein